MTQKASLFSALHALSDEITTEKTAAVRPRTKQADNPVPADPGGYQGSSTHPSAHIDNRGQASSEGSRSSENESDVKEDQGKPGVNSAPDAKPGQANDVNLNIGTQQSATGEDPSVEDDYKGGKDDPGSSHPARTDNSSLDGHKYASQTLAKCYDLHAELANSIMADLAMGRGNQLTKQALEAARNGGATLQPSAAGDNPPQQPKPQVAGQPPAGQKMAADQSQPTLSEMIEKAAKAVKAGNAPEGTPAANNADLAAGYELAAVLGVEKRAAQTVVAELIEDTIKSAQEDAEMFGAFFKKAAQKYAGDGASTSDGENHSSQGDDTSGANGGEGTGGSSSGKESGGGGASGGDSGGGPSLGDALGGGSDPGGLMGGGAPAGGDPMGGASEQDALMQLASALEELGIPLEQLAAAGGGGAPPMGGGDPLAGMGGAGGAGGGMGGEMGGGMPPAPPPTAGGMGGPMGEGMKLASAVLAFKRQGKFAFKAANAGTPERVLRDAMKGYIRELLPL